MPNLLAECSRQVSLMIVEHSEVPKGCFDAEALVDRTLLPIVARFTSSDRYAKQLLAVGDPKTPWDEAMLACNPLLNLLIGGSVMLGVGHEKDHGNSPNEVRCNRFEIAIVRGEGLPAPGDNLRYSRFCRLSGASDVTIGIS